MRAIVRLVTIGGLGALVTSCDQSKPKARNDTVASEPAPPAVVADSSMDSVATEAAWDSAAGAVLLVRGGSSDQASVVLPLWDSTTTIDTAHLDARAARGVSFDLFGVDALAGGATMIAALPVDVPTDCAAWPAAKLAVTGDSSGWKVAWVKGRVAAVRIDTLARLAPADSTRLVRELARIASGLGGDTVEALRGLPFVVRQLYRFAIPPSRIGVLAEVTRTLPQEANPLQEHLVILAEADTGSRARLAGMYAERTSGGEELLESTEVIFAGNVRATGRPILLLARYVGDGVIYSLLERTVAGQWRLRWSSAYAGC